MVDQQDKKIKQLEKEIKGWEKKYKQSVFGGEAEGKAEQKRKQEMEEFRRGLQAVQEQNRGSTIGKNLEDVLGGTEAKLMVEIVRVLGDLCADMNGLEQEMHRQGSVIQEQTMIIEQKNIELKEHTNRAEQETRRADMEAKKATAETKKVSQLERKIEVFQREFEKAQNQADSYQNKLLAEIERLEKLLRKAKPW